MQVEEFSVFEYEYVDGGNFKSWDLLLLRGKASPSDINRITSCMLDSEFFIAEQVGIPPVYSGVTKYGNRDLDVATHHFCKLRSATEIEISELKCHGSVSDIITAFEDAKEHWHYSLSPFG